MNLIYKLIILAIRSHRKVVKDVVNQDILLYDITYQHYRNATEGYFKCIEITILKRKRN